MDLLILDFSREDMFTFTPQLFLVKQSNKGIFAHKLYILKNTSHSILLLGPLQVPPSKACHFATFSENSKRFKFLCTLCMLFWRLYGLVWLECVVASSTHYYVLPLESCGLSAMTIEWLYLEIDRLCSG